MNHLAMLMTQAMRKVPMTLTIYLNSDMMVGSGQPRSSTSSTVEFWSENEKQRFTCDCDDIQLMFNF